MRTSLSRRLKGESRGPWRASLHATCPRNTGRPQSSAGSAHNRAMRFHTTILQGDKTATGIQIPDEVVEALGSGRRPPVTVTINGFTYRSSVAVVSGRVHGRRERGEPCRRGRGRWRRGGRRHRARHGAARGERAGRFRRRAGRRAEGTRDLRQAVEQQQGLARLAGQGAKTDETRQRRIAKSVETLREGRPR